MANATFAADLATELEIVLMQGAAAAAAAAAAAVGLLLVAEGTAVAHPLTEDDEAGLLPGAIVIAAVPTLLLVEAGARHLKGVIVEVLPHKKGAPLL